jgi:enamine deaminase RidA (YjgF/YER057c/UK114 family)
LDSETSPDPVMAVAVVALDEAREAVTTAAATLKADRSDTALLRKELRTLTSTMEGMRATLASETAQPTWAVVVITGLVCLLLGFGAGWFVWPRGTQQIIEQTTRQTIQRLYDHQQPATPPPTTKPKR